MADFKLAYAASAAVTITLASLASSATVGRESTAIDNGTNKYLDALVRVSIKLATGTPASDKKVYVYAYGSEDGTDYTDNASGLDAAITLRVPTNLRLIGVIEAPDAGALTYKGGPFSVAATFGGVLPRKWGLALVNFSGVAFSATEADHAVSYSGVYATV